MARTFRFQIYTMLSIFVLGGMLPLPLISAAFAEPSMDDNLAHLETQKSAAPTEISSGADGDELVMPGHRPLKVTIPNLEGMDPAQTSLPKPLLTDSEYSAHKNQLQGGGDSATADASSPDGTTSGFFARVADMLEMDVIFGSSDQPKDSKISSAPPSYQTQSESNPNTVLNDAAVEMLDSLLAKSEDTDAYVDSQTREGYMFVKKPADVVPFVASEDDHKNKKLHVAQNAPAAPQAKKSAPQKVAQAKAPVKKPKEEAKREQPKAAEVAAVDPATQKIYHSMGAIIKQETLRLGSVAPEEQTHSIVPKVDAQFLASLAPAAGGDAPADSQNPNPAAIPTPQPAAAPAAATGLPPVQPQFASPAPAPVVAAAPAGAIPLPSLTPSQPIAAAPAPQPVAYAPAPAQPVQPVAAAPTIAAPIVAPQAAPVVAPPPVAPQQVIAPAIPAPVVQPPAAPQAVAAPPATPVPMVQPLAAPVPAQPPPVAYAKKPIPIPVPAAPAVASAPASFDSSERQITPLIDSPSASRNDRLSNESRAVIKKIPSNLDQPVNNGPDKFNVEHGRDTTAVDSTMQTKADRLGVKVEMKKPTFSSDYELEKAYNALIGGDSETAITLYKSVLNNDPDNTNALFGLATAYHRVGEVGQARNYYARLLEIDPKHRDGLNNFLALVAKESPQEALEQLKTLGARNPDFSPIPAQMAVIYQKLGDLDAANTQMHHAVELSPENLTYRYNLAIICDKQQKYDEAATLYSQIVEAAQQGASIPGNVQKIQQRLTFISSNRP